MSNTRSSRFHFSLGQNIQEAGQMPASQAVQDSQAAENDQRIEHSMINGVDITKSQPVYHENDMIVIEGSDNRLMSISREKLAKGIASSGLWHQNNPTFHRQALMASIYRRRGSTCPRRFWKYSQS